MTTPTTGGPLQRTQAPPLMAADMDAGQAAAAGLGWVPKDHPLYGTPGYVGSGGQPAGGATPDAGNPNPPAGGAGANTIPGQAAAGQTYSSTPGAAPLPNTTNQASQDVVRNSYLQRASAPITDPRTRSDFRMQADTHAAATERARRDAVADSAEQFAGTGQVGAENAEARLINERAAQSRGAFEADLVRQDLQQQRADVENALRALTGMIDADQTRALQDKLAQLDAQLKTASLNASTSLGRDELALKDRLGMAGINVDILRTILQDQQFNKDLGFNIGDREAYWNQVALDRVLGN